MSFNLPISPLQFIPEHPGNNQGISLFIKRDELLHPEIQGSKGRKLAALFPRIKQSHPDGVVTFGGAFSNHLHAVAVAGRFFSIPTVGILRGEHVDLQNPTLQFCQENGMKLRRLPKAQYDACKNQGDPLLNSEFPSCYFLPEGGNTPEALEACKAIPGEIVAQLSHQHPELSSQQLYFCAPAGTGCTAAGIVAGLAAPDNQVMVFPVSNHGIDSESILQLLHNAGFQDPELKKRFNIIQGYTFGGFAKFHPAIMDIVRSFLQQTNILLDPIYTAKMLFGVFDMLAKGAFAPESTVVVLHTGGLQGWEGFNARYGIGSKSLNVLIDE
ncbi:MAG: pyridoxal-phosphate dependent enzyme [Phycisphaerae bacterium]|nr:pyridoxal-phosphate dependent enzyme [Saprospiraceae bacterium]